MSTIFSRIIAGEIPCFKIEEDENFLALLDVNPLVKGHTLVIPKVEIDYIFDVEDEMLAQMIVFSKKVARKLQSKIPCKRIGVSVIGLEVPHAHIHLILRFIAALPHAQGNGSSRHVTQLVLPIAICYRDVWGLT